jgi:asparagine synthase (glutamine-hydrolysing)
MCGIAGLFDIKSARSFHPSVITRMTDLIAHRGPDGAGVFTEPGIGLGHRRLSIIDLSAGAQPMSTADGALTVVFNGEIYNFRELRAELEALGAVFRTQSDTEVLLHGWRHWEYTLFARMEGMFALAIWDAKAQTLALARDRFGKKPLHYALLDSGVLAFGSEIKSLLALADVDRSLDPQAIADFFAYGYVPDPKTIYRSVCKLEAGCYMVVERGRVGAPHRYWSILEGFDMEFDTSEGAFTDRLARAVGRRLVADVPIGALLSGGVDSSAVVALMAGQCAEPVKAFSIGFGEAKFDETAYARLVAQRYGADLEIRRVDPGHFDLLRRLPEIYDEPFGDVSAIPTFAVCEQTAASVKVALSGDGGDEVLAGYRRYLFHGAGERLRGHIGPDMRRRVFGGLAGIYPQASWLPRALRAKTTFRELSLDSASAYARIVSSIPSELRARLFTNDFSGGLRGYDPADIVRAAYNVDAPLDPLQRAQYADMMTYLPGDILTKIDRASMANSLELRSPMLDAEFSTASFFLPPALKIAKGVGGKAILKRAMEPYLPSDLLHRPKQGFTVPLTSWFRGPLRDDILGLDKSAALGSCGMIDLGVVRDLAARHVQGLQDNSKALWLVWIFNVFLEHRPAAGVQIQ